MATLAFAFLGQTAAFSPLAQFGITALGAAIDNFFIFPPPDSRGPRLDDLAISSATEGAPRWFILGQESRLPS